ncbi:hypothetical protein VP01_432g5 [Puccinia sorghi]|uniref:Uncharacterized protein n=1 Tax=Puccinia sorghi TaxID=27349 RepID=A0A0L6URY9_9BASI|nr:hypothetical protein VP01_432g5 [Puccinia sorghi]
MLTVGLEFLYANTTSLFDQEESPWKRLHNLLLRKVFLRPQRWGKKNSGKSATLTAVVIPKDQHAQKDLKMGKKQEYQFRFRFSSQNNPRFVYSLSLVDANQLSSYLMKTVCAQNNTRSLPYTTPEISTLLKKNSYKTFMEQTRGSEQNFQRKQSSGNRPKFPSDQHMTHNRDDRSTHFDGSTIPGKSTHSQNPKEQPTDINTFPLTAVVFHLCYNAKSTLHRYCGSIVECTRHSLQEERKVLYGKRLLQEEEGIIQGIVFVITRGERYHGGVHTVDRLWYYKMRKVTMDYNIQRTRYSGREYAWSKDSIGLLGVTMLGERKEGRLFVCSLSDRIARYAGACRQPLLNCAWNLHSGLHSLYCIVHGMFGGSVWTVKQYMQRHAGLNSLYFIVHGMFGWKRQCVDSTAIYASGCRDCTDLVQFSTAIYASGCRACTALECLKIKKKG